MTDGTAADRCADCGADLALLAPACPACGATAPRSLLARCRDCGAVVDHAEPGTCPECLAAVSPWDAVVEHVRGAPFHDDVAVSDALPHPVAAGFEPGRGKPAGQRADYRRPLPDGTEIHVREYEDRYAVHRDRRSADQRLRHLARDAPLETAAGATALSVLLWAARRRPVGRGGGATAGPRRLAGRVAERLPRPSPGSWLSGTSGLLPGRPPR